MTSAGVALYTDEHIHAGLARALRERGYDAESCQEAGRAGHGISDEEQLVYAMREGRAIRTRDQTDFVQLDRRWKSEGRRHTGIIVTVTIRDFGELLRRVAWHLDTYPPTVQHNTLLWLAPVPH